MRDSLPEVFTTFTRERLEQALAILTKCPEDLGEQQRNQVHLQASSFMAILDPSAGIYAHARIDGTSHPEVTIEIASVTQDQRTYVQAVAQLLDAIAPLQPARVQLWQHRLNPIPLDRLGFYEERRLTHRQRPSEGLPPVPPLPTGITVRTFEDDDLDAFVKVNNAAFTHHPDQGGWNVETARQRLSQPWVRRDAIYLAFDTTTNQLLGFHWTKAHQDPDGTAMGEVYVIGIDPSAQGRGLGRLLLMHGLHALKANGAQALDLWVDEADLPAVALYESLDFQVISQSRCLVLPPPNQTEPAVPSQ